MQYPRITLERTRLRRYVNRLATIVMWGCVTFLVLVLLGVMIGVVHITTPPPPVQYTDPASAIGAAQ